MSPTDGSNHSSADSPGGGDLRPALFEQCGAALLLLESGPSGRCAPFEPGAVRVVDANRAAAALFGARDAGELTGPLAHLCPAVSDWWEGVAAARVGSDRSTHEVSGRTLQGGRLCLEATLAQLPGHPSRVLLTLCDRTAVHERADRLTRQVRAHAELQQLARVGVMELLLPEGVLEWSHVVATTLGFPPDTPASYARWLAALEPDDRPVATEAFESLLNGAARVGFSVRVRGEGALVRRLRCEARRHAPDDGAERITCTVQEVTDLLPSSEAGDGLRPLIDPVMPEMYLCDADSLHIIQASAAAQRLTGSATQRRSLAALLPTAAGEHLREVALDLREGCLQEALFETELAAEGGGTRPVELRVSCAAGGDPVLLVMVQDISERKRLEAARDELLVSISHELRTPLSALYGALTLVSGGVGGAIASPTTAEMVAIAQRNALRLLRLVEDLLDLHKAEAGSLPVECRPMELMPVVRQALAVHAGLAESRGVSLTLSREVPGVRVHADAERLGQVLDNLIANALRFAPGGTEVVVAVTDHVHYARVLVADNGPGVPPSLRERLFGRLARGDGPDRGGSGLGLAISRMLVDRMGGEIGCLDPPGGGACFFVELSIPDAPGAAAKCT